MSIDKESNFMAKSEVLGRRQRRVDGIFKGMENTKSGKTFRELADSLPRQQRKLKIVKDNIDKAPLKAAKGILKRSGKALKVMRKAFLRV